MPDIVSQASLDLQQALAAKLLALADDEYLLGHRDSEWTGHAPILEEDIAFANIAQDELGHAQLWLNALRGLTGADPDRLMFFRPAGEFRCCQLVELPKGDWAFSMVRQYLFDAYELAGLAEMVDSRHPAVAEIARKIQPEEVYHYRHTANWVKRLGLGAETSQARMQAALDALWPYAQQLFAPLPDDALLIRQGIFPEAEKVRAAWEATTGAWLAASGLAAPAGRAPATTDRAQHSDHLASLLAEMQEVARLEGPEVTW